MKRRRPNKKLDLTIDEKGVSRKIECFIRDQTNEARSKGVVIGMSGGIDSSLTTVLCASALEPDRVLGLLMPSRMTPKEDMEDARSLGKELGILLESIDIQPVFEAFKEKLRVEDETDQLAVGNLLPRIRMTIQYYYANTLNMLVAGASNRTELLVGYFTKYGDGGADFLPLGGLYKTQVRQMSRFLKIPDRIIAKPPSAGLWPGQTDEEEIGIDYATLDLILHGLQDLNLSQEEVAQELDLKEEIVKNTASMIERTEHKRRLPPIPRIDRM